MVKILICYRVWLRIICKLVMFIERLCYKRIRNFFLYCIKDKKVKMMGFWFVLFSIFYIYVVEIKIVLYSKMNKNIV